MRPLNKKGSQVGVVMSFTIFIISIMFIFSIISPPTKIDRNKMYSLEFLEKKVLENISEEIGIVLINDNIEMKNCLALDANSLGYGGKEFIVKNYLGNEAPSGNAGNNIYIEKGSNSFFKIYFSNIPFDKSQSYSGTDCDLAKIYSVLKQKIVFEKNVIDLTNSYQSNYTLLKTEIGISSSDDFNILFFYENGTMIGENKDNVNANIFAKTIQLNYLDLKGNKKIGELVVKIW